LEFPRRRFPPTKPGFPLRALIGFLFPHRWKGQFAQATRLLASEAPSGDGLGARLDEWLASPGWEVRNAAVKLIAHVRDEARAPRLLEKLADRSEAGIVRRNAAAALARLRLDGPAVRSALLSALADPYWEVRSEAAAALADLFPPAEDLEGALLHLLYGPRRNGRGRIREGNFEVCMACARGLGHLGLGREAYDALGLLAADDSWLVRSQAAVALVHFAARLPDYLPDARERVRAVDRLSEGAVSYFTHREVLSQALRAVHKNPQGPGPEEIRALYLNPKAGWNHVRRP